MLLLQVISLPPYSVTFPWYLILETKSERSAFGLLKLIFVMDLKLNSLCLDVLMILLIIYDLLFKTLK